MNRTPIDAMERLMEHPKVATFPRRNELRGVAKTMQDRSRLTRKQAELLFLINDLIKDSAQDDDWHSVFVQALTIWLLNDLENPSRLREEDARLVIERVLRDNEIDHNELRLIASLYSTSISTPIFFQDFVLEATRQHVLREGFISGNTLSVINQIVYGQGGYESVRTSREEADFIFELNRLCVGKPNVPEWKEFYVGALRWHVLHDAASPGRIDDREAAWLLEKMANQETIDENNKELLQVIRDNARTVPDYLAATLFPRLTLSEA